MTKRFATVAHMRVKSLAAPAVTLALLVVLLVLLGRTYFGHAPGPYGVCYGASGRSIPCVLSATRR